MPDERNEEAGPGRIYPWYALTVLVLVYVLNFIDRQIVVILAERIKADLKVTDAQLGFLYGTVFAVFFAVFAIPLGRLADAWDRRRLIAWGTAFWSVMTALSGLARGFGPLALARLGVGAGEASAAFLYRVRRLAAYRSNGAGNPPIAAAKDDGGDPSVRAESTDGQSPGTWKDA